jgi:hypothetical protein
MGKTYTGIKEASKQRKRTELATKGKQKMKRKE